MFEFLLQVSGKADVFEAIIEVIAKFFREMTSETSLIVRNKESVSVASILLGIWGAARWFVAIIGLSVISKTFQGKASKTLAVICFILGFLAVFDIIQSPEIPIFLVILAGIISGSIGIIIFRKISAFLMRPE